MTTITQETQAITEAELQELDLDDQIDSAEVESVIDGDAQVKAKTNKGNGKPLNRKLTQALINSDRALAVEITSNRILDAFETLAQAQAWLAECWPEHEAKRFAAVDSLTGDLSPAEKARLLERLKAELGETATVTRSRKTA